MKKYELTAESIVKFGRTLFRIKALVAFGDVKEGELGGFVEKEENLDQGGNAWVSGAARVSGAAQIFKTSHYLVVGPLGRWAEEMISPLFSGRSILQSA